MIKFKSMKRENWEIGKKTYYSFPSLIEEGITSITYIDYMFEPISFPNKQGESIIVLDNHYYWLQIAYKDQPYWISTFYNQNLELKQVYIDIIDFTDYSDSIYPTMQDLYVDIIIENGQYYSLDERELEEAYLSGEITQKQYNHARAAFLNLCKELDENLEPFLENIKKELNCILHKLEI